MRAALLGLFVSLPALAWESVCAQHPDPSLTVSELAALKSSPSCTSAPGPLTARNRWIAPLDEHRLLFEAARARAGIPAAVSATQTLEVFTASTTVKAGQADLPTLTPVSFETATRTALRHFSVGELSQLPDFSWSLWDWASGHETCPLPGVTPNGVDCHDFAAHMGPVNSNHFVPQSKGSYARYHALAMARAGECAALKTKLASSAGRFSAVLRACEVEALALEAVGQHYLQDAWSMGHMWQRWGSSNLDDFPGATVDEKRDVAVLTALASGLIHGARGVLQVLPSWSSYEVNDALCAPWDDVRYQKTDGSFAHGMGDDYLDVLLAAPSTDKYFAQSSALADCTAAGVKAVYDAAGQNHGAPSPAMPVANVDPASDVCFGQRATNAAIARAAAVQVKVAGQQLVLPLDARLVGWMLPKVARMQGKVDVPPKLRNRFRFDLQRAVTLARIVGKSDPNGTSLAEGRMGALMGAQPNGQYLAPAPYEEPALPWSSNTDARVLALSRTFHQAHAAEHCASTTSATLAAAKTHAQNPAHDGTTRAAACRACAVLVERHLRVGASASSYDVAREPLCTYLVASPALVYQAGTGTPAQLAAQHCCP